MAVNVEMKARVSDLSAVRAKAKALVVGPPQTIAQTDTFFDVPRGRRRGERGLITRSSVNVRSGQALYADYPLLSEIEVKNASE